MFRENGGLVWGQKRVWVPWGEMDRACCAPFSTMHPSASLAALQGSVAVGFGLWGLGQRVFLGLSEHQPLAQGGPSGGLPPLDRSSLISSLEALALCRRLEKGN